VARVRSSAPNIHRSYAQRSHHLPASVGLSCAKIGVSKQHRVDDLSGERPERFRELEEVRERNARKIEERPEIVFDNLTRRQSTFTRRDIAREVFRYVDDGERLRNLMTRLEGSSELIVLVPEGRAGQTVEEARYTSKAMLRVEERMAELAFEMAATDHHPVRDGVFALSVSRHGDLSTEQREALRQITSPRDIEVVAGFAGTGKSATVAAAKDAWKASGYRVRGAALSGIATENLERSSGVESRTLASWELAWRDGKAEISSRDVLVIDEAGMVGSRQMARILTKLHEAGAKAVLIGDTAQLQPIEAGAAFRAIAERTGYQELTGIRRQQAEWQREASRDFARGDAGAALDRYQEHRAIRFAASHEQTKDDLIRDWSDQRAAQPERSSLILAHTRADIGELNQRARRAMKRLGGLGPEVKVETWREVTRDDGSIAIEYGERLFAPGDRVMFLKNDRALGVKNGSLGTVASVTPDSMRVALDGKESREVRFAPGEYGSVEYGYAATMHKAQGATVDRVFALATPGMDRHLAYVGMTRHREEARLYAGQDDFKNFEALRDRLSRARAKDATLDYSRRRGLELAAQLIRKPKKREATEKKRTDLEPIERFKEAQREFISVAGRFDLDPDANKRAVALRREMKSAAEEISKSTGLMREAERAGIAGQVKNLSLEKERALGKDRGVEIER